MRWARITKLSAVLALAALATVVIGASPAWHWAKAELRNRAERPEPIIAAPQETRDILDAVLKHMKFVGIPLPPPEPNEPSRPQPTRTLILADQSICFAQGTNTDCEEMVTGPLLGRGLDPFAPKKFRAELLAANQSSHQLGLDGIPGSRVANLDEIQHLFAGGWWPDFYKEYPDSAGYARISQPVLSEDRMQALIYVTHHCGGKCGTGTIFLLVRSGTGWKVDKLEMLWIG